MLSIRRLVAASTVLLIVFAAAAPAVAACAGWSMAPGDRHACCAHLGELASTGSVTDCCAGAEQSNGLGDRDHQLPPSVSTVSIRARLPVPPLEASRSLVDRALVHPASPPKYVLLGAFLI